MIFSTQATRSFCISSPQKRRTFQLLASRVAFTEVSLSMLVSIFLCQNSSLDLWSCFLVSQSLPCQNSPSQKMATLWRRKTMSGLPVRSPTLVSKRKPCSVRVLMRSCSILEPLLLTALIPFRLCSTSGSFMMVFL